MMDKEYIGIKQATAKGYIECEIGGVADFSYPTSKIRRGRVQGGGHVCPTLTAQSMGICRIEKFDRGGQDGMQHNDISEDKEIDVAILSVSYPSEDVAVILYKWSDGLH